MRNRQASLAKDLARIKQEIQERAWYEYDKAAEQLAKEGRRGLPGDPLPDFMSRDAAILVNADPEAFYDRVKAFSYALSMKKGESGNG